MEGCTECGLSRPLVIYITAVRIVVARSPVLVDA